ncbi:MAG: response regulator, partial [Bdellovibrionota bacterium]
MPKIRVLIVDDSIVFRSQIRASLEGSDMIEVVGVASHGKIAIEKMKQTTVDLVTLDLEMPEMNGLETLNEMRKQGLKAQVIVFSSQSQKGAKATIEALNSGASDFVPKPAGTTVETAAQ